MKILAVFVVLVALVFLLSCSTGEGEVAPGAAAGSEATPTPVPEGTLAGEEHSCNLMNTPYDTFGTAVGTGGEWRGEIRYSGPDRHMVSTSTDHEGIFVGKIEMIIKDRTMYSRESTLGNPQVYGEWSVGLTDVPEAFPPPCLDPSSLERDASGSLDEPHFTSDWFISEGQGAMRSEYWVDSTGRPTRVRETQFPPEYDGVTNTDTIVTEYTYSGYGEANIIEAPCASAAPDEADNPALMRDCVHLLALKDTLRGTATLNWSLDTAITSWDGVTLGGNPTRVTRLLLSKKGLNGSIPLSFGSFLHLTHLTELDLSGNSLTGDIPDELENLEELRLSGNPLTGCIPLSLKDVATNDLSSLNLLYCQPPTPENLTVGTVGETSVSLSWDAVTNARKYRVEYVPGGGGVVVIDDDTIMVTTHTVEGLICESEYEFLVSAYDSGVQYAEAWSDTTWISGSTGECTGP